MTKDVESDSEKPRIVIVGGGCVLPFFFCLALGVQKLTTRQLGRHPDRCHHLEATPLSPFCGKAPENMSADDV